MTYYVSQESHGSGDGKSYENRMSVSKHNNSNFSPGDKIYLSGAITTQIVIPSSGVERNHIIYDGNFGVTYDAFTGNSGPATIDRGWKEGDNEKYGISGWPPKKIIYYYS